MFSPLIRTTLCLALLLAGPAAAAAADATADQQQLKEVIKQVIRENPKLLYDTITQYHQELQAQQRHQQLESSFTNRIADQVVAHNPVKGPQDAAVTIITYTDFECPYCARGAQTAARVLELYPEKTRLVFKNLPLKSHENALPAARAALAAQRQGKFWEYHDLLFQNSGQLADERLVALAGELGLDEARFNRDRQSAEIAAEVEADLKQAAAHNLSSTPTFVINGVVVTGAQPLPEFQRVVDRLLAEAAAKKKAP
ncbi:MAG: thioredoxin domain-containing protein [Desulfobacterales bacterium]|nr:thioredoxin domain-containing protein [Desulfobacterales bacterium]